MTNVTQEPRARPYLGGYIPEVPRVTRPITKEQRLAFLVEGARLARANAHRARRDGDPVGSSAAFYRAHEYCEMIRKLKAKL